MHSIICNWRTTGLEQYTLLNLILLWHRAKIKQMGGVAICRSCEFDVSKVPDAALAQLSRGWTMGQNWNRDTVTSLGPSRKQALDQKPWVGESVGAGELILIDWSRNQVQSWVSLSNWLSTLSGRGDPHFLPQIPVSERNRELMEGFKCPTWRT